MNLKKGIRIVVAAFVLMQGLNADWRWISRQSAAESQGANYRATFRFQSLGKKQVRVDELVFPCSCIRYSFETKKDVFLSEETLVIWLPKEQDATLGENLEVIVFGSDGATTTALRIRLPGEKP